MLKEENFTFMARRGALPLTRLRPAQSPLWRTVPTRVDSRFTPGLPFFAGAEACGGGG